jgi:hypothetical protein
LQLEFSNGRSNYSSDIKKFIQAIYPQPIFLFYKYTVFLSIRKADSLKGFQGFYIHSIDNWAHGNLEERDIRAGSGMLRRLLVHNELIKVSIMETDLFSL